MPTEALILLIQEGLFNRIERPPSLANPSGSGADDSPDAFAYAGVPLIDFELPS